MKLKLIMLVSLFAFGFALSANAGSVLDSELDGTGDSVPDQYDNCVDVDNGPTNTSASQQDNQVDSDNDGYGNACDTDYNQDGATSTLDFPTFLNSFTGVTPASETDHNGDGSTTTLDFTTFFGAFTSPPGAPGPGLACANLIGTTCTP